MIKNIVFDMGQVLIKFDPNYFMEKVGITNLEDQKIMMREVYKSIEWRRMDRGSLSEKEVHDLLIKRLPEHLRKYAYTLICDWYHPLIPIEGMATLCKELHENGYKLYLLSNASFNQKAYWPDIPGSEYFDGRIVSSEVGYVKPQPEIFQTLLTKYHLIADECVFMDDDPNNCEGAYYCGINTFIFHGDVNECRTKLKEFGVNIK